MQDLPDHARENRRYWNGMADEWVAAGERSWSTLPGAESWGNWGVPESTLHLLPPTMERLRAVELGCGTAYGSAWMARRGAEVTGIDVSERQLATAQRLATEHGVSIELVHGSAEATPFGAAAFDFALSEYGAALWCDPDAWIAEAARVLRPGGQLVFLTSHPLTMVCAPADGSAVTTRLERPYFGMRRHDWTSAVEDPGGVEFVLTVSGWFATLQRHGFVVERLLEPQAEDGAPDEERFSLSRRWASRWPSEIVIAARRT